MPAITDYVNWHYTFAIAAALLWIKINPAKRLLEHFLGTCYRVTYTDTHGAPHAFRVITKDPREAALVQLVMLELQNDPDTLRPMPQKYP